MPSKVCPANKSSLFAVTGSTELGGGQDRHLPVGGPWNGYTFASAIRFGFDWSDVRRITSATLRVRTSGQVHVGFSSSPDFYVARATADWSANGSSASGEGGSGWSTSPTVYPGPPTTTTGRVSKRSSTSEGVDVLVDITAIVRAWAPATVEGGGASPNYGLVLSRVASGDVTEFASNVEPGASLRPYITLAYETDSPPPAPTITYPTSGLVTIDPTPTLAATSVDPNGDPLDLADVEVRKAGAVVYSALGIAPASATTISHEPPSALPSGDLTVRMRARAAGVWGAWSAELPFTIDRPATVTGWTSPPASVSGNRRPALAFTTADLDGDLVELYDVEVYPASAGVPSAGVAYAARNQTLGITGAAGAQSVSHAPTLDLPIGEDVARSRVRTRGVWSAWSAYRAFTIVVAVPAVTITAPATEAGYIIPGSWAPPPAAITSRSLQFSADVRPPAGFTLTKVHHKLTRLSDVGAPAVVEDVDLVLQPAGGVYVRSFTPTALGFTSLFGTFRSEWTATASNAGVTGPVVRTGRFAIGEWLGALALGDSVAKLAIPVEAALSDFATVYYRAQSSTNAPNGAAPWRRAAEVATIQAELPATNAYLGIDVRLARRADDAEQVVNGDFESGLIAPWIVTGTGVGIGTDANAPAGPKMCVVNGDGGPSNPGVAQKFPVIAGATYRATCYGRVAAGTGKARLQIVTRNPAGGIVLSGALIVETALAAWTLLTGTFVVPADGSVASVDLIMRIPTTVATDSVRFDGASLVGPVVGDGGFDRLCVTWQSLG